MITGLAFVAYPVADLERATAFYRDVVGLAVGERFGDSVVEFAVGDATFAVDVDAIGSPGTQFGAAFATDDVEGTHRAFVAHDVTVTEVMEFAPCRLFFATDPDGNRFAIHELRRRPEGATPG